jgi:hypothetical protein
VLAVPVQGQFEQALNARYLEKLGYGRCTARLDDPAVLAAFKDAIPGCEERLATYEQDGNQALLTALDAKLASIS